MKHAQLSEVLEWVEVSAPEGLYGALERFESWLASEGAAAGGIGPGETPSLWERHILDALMFSVGAPAPARILDLGSGVGLPGIPLALLHPDADVVLVDRSGRRVRLARRAARVAGARNVSVVQADFDSLAQDMTADLVVMRASLPVVEARAVLARHRARGGIAILGVGVTFPDDLPDVVRFPGSSILDPGRWLHIMR